MILNRNSQIVATEPPKPVQYAISALQRDKKAVFTETGMPGGDIVLAKDSDLPPECFCLQVHEDRLMLTAADALGFVYGLFEISRRFLGVQPFWFWNDQKFIQTDGVTVPQNFTYESKPARVRYRGWFVNDETLISHWKVERRSEMPFVMVFETLLRLGGNLVIPGTGKTATATMILQRIWASSSPTTMPSRWEPKCLCRRTRSWNQSSVSTRKSSARSGSRPLTGKKYTHRLEHRVPGAGR